jgi:hypothetical protein
MIGHAMGVTRANLHPPQAPRVPLSRLLKLNIKSTENNVIGKITSKQVS